MTLPIMDKRLKILLVDDEPDVASMIKMRLEASGYEVIIAADGNTVGNMVKCVYPDLIISDIMCAGMGGYQLCQQVKKDPKQRDIPVIILTTQSQKEDKEFGKRVGADAYLTKPFEVKELLDTIKKLLGNKGI